MKIQLDADYSHYKKIVQFSKKSLTSQYTHIPTHRALVLIWSLRNVEQTL